MYSDGGELTPKQVAQRALGLRVDPMQRPERSAFYAELHYQKIPPQWRTPREAPTAVRGVMQFGKYRQFRAV